jgi:Bacterial Ig-like domain (group 3)
MSANGAASEQGGSPLTANTFGLQLNSNFIFNHPLCGGVAGCFGWLQFVFVNGQPNNAHVWLEYWLAGRGNTCPPGPWINFMNSCIFDTMATPVPVQTVADLRPGGLTLTATATAGGQDVVTVGTSGGSLFSVGQDSMLNMSQYWNIAEFNVFGPAGGTQAVFSNPTTFDVKTSINDGTANPPSCLHATTTAETNNLNLVACCPYGGATPAIEFMETNAGHTATCGPTAIEGDPHITTADGGHYDFQSAGEFISLRDPDGTEIQTRQAPVSTTFIGTDKYDGLTTCVSLNTAVAARVGKHRLSYEPNVSGVPDPSGLQLRIDGALTTPGPQVTDLGDGGRVFKSSTGELEVDFPDGKTLFVTPEWWSSQSKWYLNVDVNHLGLVSIGGASGRGLSLGGIAGPMAGGSWLPALANGASLGPMPASLQDRYTTLYKTFADAWRVTNKDSLFDYAPGTSTETFTMREWPPQQPPCVVPNTKPVEPASEAFAEAACRRVLDEKRHSDCVFDVRVTGDPVFAKTYQVTQRVLADSTTISLTAAPESSQVGEPVTFIAFVAANGSAAAGFPSGAVQFAIDGSNVGEPITVDAKGRATWERSRLKVGTHRVMASYVPALDSAFLPSTSTEKIHVVRRCRCDADREQK